MDQNDDYLLSNDEWIHFMLERNEDNKSDEKEIEEMVVILNEADHNRDGQMSFVEFVEFLASLAMPANF